MLGLADRPAAVAEAGYSTKTPFETLVADPTAKAVIDQELPGLAAHEMFGMFKAMSLEDVQPMSGGQITSEKLQSVNAALAKLKLAAKLATGPARPIRERAS